MSSDQVVGFDDLEHLKNELCVDVPELKRRDDWTADLAIENHGLVVALRCQVEELRQELADLKSQLDLKSRLEELELVRECLRALDGRWVDPRLSGSDGE